MITRNGHPVREATETIMAAGAKTCGTRLAARAAFVAGLALLLAACAQGRIAVTVTPFYESPPGPLAGLAADVVPARPELAQDPAFADFGDRLGAKLARLGLIPAAGGPAAIHARLDYESRPRDERREGSRVGVGIGIGHVGRHVGVGGTVGVPIETGRRVTVYDHRVSVALVRADDGAVLWEGRALADGVSAPLAEVIDAMLDALFTDFPGQSGATRTVRLPAKADSGAP